ncbi:MAG: hypothetical protein AB7T07_08790 [Steroidobacteraceae bacterium]
MLRTKMSIVSAITTALLVFGQPVFAADAASEAQASTKAEHEAAASSYTKEAAALREKAAKHLKDSKTYTVGRAATQRPQFGQISKHCENLSKEYSKAATELEAMAKIHSDMAAMVH